MTDDPRLFDVIRALSVTRDAQNVEEPQRAREAREFCAMIRAFLGEDAERKEVMPHPEPRPAQHNATAPVAAGADPPWLDEAIAAALPDFHGTYPMRAAQCRAIILAAQRVANAQPVSEEMIDAAIEAFHGEPEGDR